MSLLSRKTFLVELLIEILVAVFWQARARVYGLGSSGSPSMYVCSAFIGTTTLGKRFLYLHLFDTE